VLLSVGVTALWMVRIMVVVLGCAAWQEEDDDWGIDLQSEAQEEEERRAREASSEFARRLEAALSTPPPVARPVAGSTAVDGAVAAESDVIKSVEPEPDPEPKSASAYEEF
jgi:hypothetical protein